jgi:hypothetical protein
MPLRHALAAAAASAPWMASAETGGGIWIGMGTWLAVWVVVSIAATAVVSVWFRARARANERLSARIRREDWLAAAGASAANDREPE